ncbi:hypothetical protein [Methylosinus sp. PW1]|uniref:hypothetical protein n=1 Tax=Methylosinus sp. PW1 TaxID=107636 RepID=UPI000569B6A2|nr:hypothetical protein [Methylosinus sp. PW1]
MILIIDSTGSIFAAHADGQIETVLAASDYSGKAVVSVPDSYNAQPGGAPPEGAVVLRPAGGVYVPQSITRLQFVRQSKALGIWSSVQAYLSANPEADDWWTYASAIERQSPVLIAAATAFGMDSAAVDAFFIAAAELV